MNEPRCHSQSARSLASPFEDCASSSSRCLLKMDERHCRVTYEGESGSAEITQRTSYSCNEGRDDSYHHDFTPTSSSHRILCSDHQSQPFRRACGRHEETPGESRHRISTVRHGPSVQHQQHLVEGKGARPTDQATPRGRSTILEPRPDTNDGGRVSRPTSCPHTLLVLRDPRLAPSRSP